MKVSKNSILLVSNDIYEFIYCILSKEEFFNTFEEYNKVFYKMNISQLNNKELYIIIDGIKLNCKIEVLRIEED